LCAIPERVRVNTLPTGVSEVNLGSDLEVNVEVALDTLTPEDVPVEMLTGRVDAQDQLQEQAIMAMECSGRETSGNYRFRAVWQPSKSGLCGYAIWVLPKHRDAVSSFLPSMITRAEAIPVGLGKWEHT
jgi:glycogen phosphorylase